MRNLKKFLALVMAMMMTLSLMVTANAATSNKEFSDSGSVTPAFEEDLLVVNGMGIIQGYEDGSFGPQRTITRGQMAAIIYRIATGDATDAYAHNYVGYNTFTDVKDTDWFAGYVGYCANAGYIQGYGDGRFGPFNDVTGYQALAMILRAMGYNEEGHNFTGTGWETYTASTATQRGMLVNVNNTNYRNTLRQPAPRELVAEMAFQGLTKAMVQYTPAFGYQTTGMEGGLLGSSQNPSLGYLYYGLTSNTGVIVGNEATGEGKGVTKIGFSLASARTASEIIGEWSDETGGADNPITNGYINTNQIAFATAIDNNLGIRERDEDGDGTTDAWRSAYVYDSDTVNALPGNVTRAFKWDSNLDNFNHAVKVWYDCRSSQNVTVGNGTNGTAQFTTNLNTYAVFDRSTNVAVVSLGTPDRLGQAAANETTAVLGTVGTPGNLGVEATEDTVNKVENNWKAPGFTLRNIPAGDGVAANNKNVAYWNYSFGPNLAAGYVDSAVNADAADAATVSPVNQNNQDIEWPLYLLISNSPNKELDVVIPLDMTFTRITQVNDTTAPLSVGVINGNDSPVTGSSTKDYFDTDNQVSGSASQVEYGNIAQENLVCTPTHALNTRVAAIEITGTAGKNALTRVPGNVGEDDFGFADDVAVVTTAAADYSTYYYQLTETKTRETYTVLAINPNNQDLTVVKDGVTSVLHQSVFAEATDASFTTNIEGVAISGAVGSQTQDDILKVNRNYTFTLDREGHYIYWETAANTSNFIYATYMDRQSDTASSVFDYPTVYVDAAGQAKRLANMTSIDGNAIGGNDYYNRDLTLPKRTNTGGNANQYARGWYGGFAYNEGTGALTSIDTYANSGDQGTGFYKGSAADFGSDIITIDSTDVLVTAKQIAAVGSLGIDLFLTEDTQFYLVDGAGTSNQSVKPFKGISELLGDHSSVIINVSDAGVPASPLDADTRYLTATSVADPNADRATGVIEEPYGLVYYELDRQDYAQDYLGSAYYVKTVFIPEIAVSYTDDEGSSLFFVGDNSVTNINAVGDNATQFTFYDVENGNASSRWILGLTTTAGTPAAVVGDDTTVKENVFYRLVDTGKKAADGQPIYTIRNADTAPVIGKAYDGYTAATDTYALSTAVVGVTTGPAHYAATTSSAQAAYIYDTGDTPDSNDLFNVASAKITNLDAVKYPGIAKDNLSSLNNAGSLTDNTSVEVSCVHGTSGSARVISMIFVNAPVTP